MDNIMCASTLLQTLVYAHLIRYNYYTWPDTVRLELPYHFVWPGFMVEYCYIVPDTLMCFFLYYFMLPKCITLHVYCYPMPYTLNDWGSLHMCATRFHQRDLRLVLSLWFYSSTHTAIPCRVWILSTSNRIHIRGQLQKG